MAGLEYIVEDLSTHPQCAHGPTLLFSRSVNDNGERRKFFACSACRDRKQCQFFLWEDEKDKVDEHRKKMWATEKRKQTLDINHIKLFVQLNEIQSQSETNRSYCFTCNIWVYQKSLPKHEEHDVKTGVTNYDLTHPTTFLKPLSNDKKEAQYLFTDSCITTILDVLQSQKIKNVLCIGAPRIHEKIQSDFPNMTSLLMDLDHRFHNFYGPLQFCWYNLFNHHFFQETSKETYLDFLQSNKGEGVAVLIDPPFGGRVEPIAETLKRIEQQYQTVNKINSELPIFLFFPYFMEPQILNSLPDFKMVDYKVGYDNHPLFKENSKGRKFGSPVRIFTNVSLAKVELPASEGYRYCKLCKRWVYAENQHCSKCNSCTSKDGRTYVHCNKCQRCIKPSWKHCDKCEKCAQVDHKCGQLPFTQTCFHCKEQGHKKSNCPKVDHENLKRKRMQKMDNKKKRKIT